jgi:predicted Zn finger-like uncharacterized protein
MLIACPKCTTSYEVNAATIGANGRSVRCVRCRTIWFATPPAEVPALAVTEPAASIPAPASDETVAAFKAELSDAPAEPEAEATAPAETPPAATDAAAGDTAVPAVEAAADGPSIADLMADGTAENATEKPTVTDIESAAAAGSDAAAGSPEAPLPVADAPPLAPAAPGPAPAAEPAATLDNQPEDIETRAARRRGRPGMRRARAAKARPSRVSAAIAGLLLVLAGFITWRLEIVRHAPQLASLYGAVGLPVNLRKLAFADVTITKDSHDGVPVLVVEGTIVSTSSAPVDVPRLRFAVRNEGGAEVYAWTAVPTQATLGPFESLPFRSRLAAPPQDGRDVVVRFFNRRDNVAGIR